MSEAKIQNVRRTRGDTEDVINNRRERLRLHFEGQALPKEEKSYLSQILRGKKSCGEKAARRLETVYGIEKGLLDKPLQSNAAPKAHQFDADLSITPKRLISTTAVPHDVDANASECLHQHSKDNATDNNYAKWGLEGLNQQALRALHENGLIGPILKLAGLTDLDEHNGKIIFAPDNSMEPTILMDDILVIDTSEAATKIQSGKIYAISMGDQLMIKRLVMEFGTLLLRSDHPNKAIYADIRVPVEIDLQVLGRVVWHCSEL